MRSLSVACFTRRLSQKQKKRCNEDQDRPGGLYMCLCCLLWPNVCARKEYVCLFCVFVSVVECFLLVSCDGLVCAERSRGTKDELKGSGSEPLAVFLLSVLDIMCVCAFFRLSADGRVAAAIYLRRFIILLRCLRCSLVRDNGRTTYFFCVRLVLFSFVFFLVSFLHVPKNSLFLW